MANETASNLIKSCLQHISTERRTNHIYHAPLENELGRIKLWADGFGGLNSPVEGCLGAENNCLDEVLGRSGYLTEPTVALLTSLSSCLLMKEFAQSMGPIFYILKFCSCSQLYSQSP